MLKPILIRYGWLYSSLKKGNTTVSKRGEFLLKAMELGLSADTILEYVDQFEGKTDKEKERMAGEFLTEISGKQNHKNQSSLPIP